MAKEKKEVAIKRIMEGLGCTAEEAEDVYAYDEKVDHNEKTEYDLTGEQLKEAKKATRTGTRKTPTAYKFTKRERKPNATKGGIISELAKFLAEDSNFSVENCEITNKERQVAFSIGEDRFELTLVQKRKPKA